MYENKDIKYSKYIVCRTINNHVWPAAAVSVTVHLPGEDRDNQRFRCIYKL